MRLIGRLGALVLGLIGAVIGLVVNFAYSAFHDIARWAGDTHMDSTHGFIGFFVLVAGIIGSLITPVAPSAAAVLLLIAGIGIIFIVKWFALIITPFFLVAAVLAYLDRPQRAVA